MSGFILKDATLAEVREAFDAALSGRGVYLHPVITQHLLAQRSSDTDTLLTERELDVILGHETVAAVAKTQGPVREGHREDRHGRFGRHTREEADRSDERQRRRAYDEPHCPVNRGRVEQLGDGGLWTGMRLGAGSLPLRAPSRQADQQQDERGASSHLLNLKSAR